MTGGERRGDRTFSRTMGTMNSEKAAILWAILEKKVRIWPS
jgi:hypothetical protein